MTRRAKIVCTLGPATDPPGALEALVAAGMDVARLNLSHGTHEDAARRYARVRAASDATGRAVAILADLQGPKIRLGPFEGGRVRVDSGAPFTITVKDVVGTAERVSTSHTGLPQDVKRGDPILVDDGRVRLEVIAVTDDEVRTRVVDGGTLSDHKGLNLPGTRVSAPALTGKDRDDLAFVLSLRVDAVALSFVRDAADADPVRTVMREAGAGLPVIAKLEKPQAVESLEAVVDAFDGLMVARGDLGVEIPLERVPLVQKQAIQLARERHKPVIVATQMLDSMIRDPRPTRAEVSDVANAVLDGADALMLSGETSIGAHAREAVETMARVITTVEDERLDRIPPLGSRPHTRADAIAAAATEVAAELGARALIAFTQSGSTARRLACHRRAIPLLAFTTEPAVRSQLAMTWGVETFVMPMADHTDAMVAQVDEEMLRLGRGRAGDVVVVVAGSPPGASGSTNMLRVHRLGGA